MKWIISVLMTLISLVAHSQNYPKLTVIGTDSLCILTMPQVRDINEKLIELDESMTKLDQMTKITNNYKLAIKSLNRQLELETQSKSNLEIQLNNLNEQNELNKDIYKKMKRKYVTISGISITLGLTCLLLAL